MWFLDVWRGEATFSKEMTVDTQFASVTVYRSKYLELNVDSGIAESEISFRETVYGSQNTQQLHTKKE